MRLRGALPIVGSIALVGCFAFVPMPDEPLSVGHTNRGYLHAGVALPDRGAGYVRARPGEPTRFGTPRLVAALERAAAAVDARFAGTAPVRIGDLSSPRGGRHHRHGSHRSGLDADVLLYMTDAAGRSLTGRGWLAYNRFGTTVESASPGDGPPSNGLFLLDDARSWWFARTLLLDEEAGVQWLFVSRGVKSRLLAYAVDHETDSRAIARAAAVLHQPTRAAPHDDHFHVRILCSPRERARGCMNRGPVWPWLRADFDKAETVAGESYDDEAIVRELLEPIEAEGDEAAGSDAGGEAGSD